MQNNVYTQIVYSLLESQKRNSIDIAIINNPNNFLLPVNYIKEMAEELKYIFYYHQYDARNIQQPFNPFLKWIKEIYYDKYSDWISIDDFLKKCNVYPMQRNVFKTYFEKENCEKKDVYIAIEGAKEYEQQKTIEALADVIRYICKDKKICVVLNDMHFSCSSSIKLLIQLLNKSVHDGQIIFVCNYNENYILAPYIKNDWGVLVQECIHNEQFFENPLYGDKENDNNRQSEFIFEKEKLDEYIKVIISCINCSEIEQAVYYLDLIQNTIVYNKIKVSNKQRNNVYFLYAFCDVYSQNFQHARIILNVIKPFIPDLDIKQINEMDKSEIDRRYNEIEALFFYNYLDLFLWDDKNQIRVTKGKKNIQIAKKLNNDKYYFLAKISSDVVEMFTQTVEHSNIHPREYYEAMIKEAEENEYISAVIFYLSCAYENTKDELLRINEGGEVYHFEIGVQKAVEYGNMQLLKHMYNYKNRFAYHYECNNAVITYAKICNKYILNEKDKVKVNGFSYMLLEQYDIAFEVCNDNILSYYHSYLKNKMNNELQKDNSLNKYYLAEICIILKDIAINCIFTKNYRMAEKYIGAVLEIMGNIQRTIIFNASFGELHSLIAYCRLKQRMFSKCYTNINKAEVYFSFTDNEYTTGVETFIFYFVKGTVFSYEKKFDESERCFEKAKNIIEKDISSMFLFYDLFCIEFASMLRKKGESDKSIELLKKGITFYKNKKMVKKMGRLQASLIGEEYNYNSCDFVLEKITLQELVQASAIERKEIRLAEEQHNNFFMAMWRENINNLENEEYGPTEKAISILKTSYEMDYLVYIKLDDNGYKVVNCDDTKRILTVSEINIILDNLKISKEAFYITRLEKKFYMFKNILNIFGINDIDTFVYIPVLRGEKICRLCIMYHKIHVTLEAVADRYTEDKRLETIKMALSYLVDAEYSFETRKQLKTYQRSLEDAVKKAKDANQAKSKFLANVSHEIRTPMNAIIGMSEVSLQYELPDESRESFSNILQAGNNLLTMINSILDFSKIEAGKLEIIEARYTLSGLVNEIKEKYSDIKKNILLEIKFIKNEFEVLIGDSFRIKQIIENFVSNAIKFTDKGYIKVLIKCEKTNEQTVNLIVNVEDSGRGIKEEDMKLLFQSFERIDIKKNRSLEGTGLGLAICKQLVELMGGSVSVNSKYGEGSIFSFSIPQRISTEQDIKDNIKEEKEFENKIPESFILKDTTILVVDDNDMNIKVAQGLLEPYKCRVLSVCSGYKCYDLVFENKEKIDLILLDHMMPGMDGIETLRKLKKINKFNIPTVALTANTTNGISKLYINEGFDGYLSKPINLKKLKEILFRILNDKILICKKESNDRKQVSLDKAKDILKEYDIDFEISMNYFANSIELFNEMIEWFINNAESTIEQLDAYVQQNDLETYCIKVHALKGNAKCLGAMKLLEVALKHEQESRNKNMEFVKENKQLLYGMILKTCDGFNEYKKVFLNKTSLTSKSDNEKISIEKLFDELTRALNLLQEFEDKASKEILKKLTGYSYEDVEDKFNGIEKYVKKIYSLLCDYKDDDAELELMRIINIYKYGY